MKNKKSNFKKFITSEKVQFTFLAILSILILLVSVIVPKFIKNNTKVLKTENKTELRERKNRIVNNYEIWSENISTGIQTIQGISGEVYVQREDINEALYIYRTLTTGSFEIILKQSYNNVRISLFLGETITNVQNVNSSNSTKTYTKRMPRNADYNMYTAYITESCDRIVVNVNANSQYNGTLKVMITNTELLYTEYQQYGQIGYTTEYYNSQMEKTPLQIIQQNMTIVNDKNRWTFPSIYTNRFATNTILNNTLKVYVKNSDLSIAYNRLYNGITYSQSYYINGRYEVITKLNEDYINIDNSQNYMNTLIGFELKCYMPIEEKELLLDVWYNSTSNIDTYTETDNEEREVITYTTNEIKNISFSALLSYSKYQEEMILVKNIEFYKNVTNDIMDGQNRVIAYESNIVNNESYKYYNKGVNEGIDKVITNPKDYNLYTQLEYTNYGDSKYQQGLEENYSLTNEIGGLINLPFTFAKDSLNWNFFGLNLYELFTSALGILLMIWILKKIL